MTFTELARPWVAGLGVYEPGRPIEDVARELGFEDASQIIKMASNENALGPSPKAVAAMKKAARQMHLYPDGGAFYLRRDRGASGARPSSLRRPPLAKAPARSRSMPS